MTYLITGFNGFVGKHFFKYLKEIEKDAIIYGIGRNPCNFKNYKQIDLINRELVFDVIHEIKPDYIVHLAAVSSVSQSWQNPANCFLNNTSTFLNIADAVKDFKLKCRILSVGSSEEYGIYDEIIKENFVLHPKNPYSVARLSQEYLSKLYVDNFGLDIVMTRSFNHIGPGQNEKFVIPSFVKQLIDISNGKQNEIYVGNIEVIRDFLDVRDVASAYYKILKYSKNREVYNVCSSKGTKIKDIIDLISKNLKITPQIIADKTRIRTNEIMSVIGDNSKLKNDLGWSIKYGLENTIDDMIKYYKSN